MVLSLIGRKNTMCNLIEHAVTVFKMCGLRFFSCMKSAKVNQIEMHVITCFEFLASKQENYTKYLE